MLFTQAPYLIDDLAAALGATTADQAVWPRVREYVHKGGVLLAVYIGDVMNRGDEEGKSEPARHAKSSSGGAGSGSSGGGISSGAGGAIGGGSSGSSEYHAAALTALTAAPSSSSSALFRYVPAGHTTLVRL